MAAAAVFAQDSPAPTPTPTPAPADPPAAPSPAPSPETGGGAVNPTFFNPAIAVIGNFVGVTGRNEVEDRPSLQMLESEVTFQAVVDPYARADVFVAITDDEVELEEGFITFQPSGRPARQGRQIQGAVRQGQPHALPHAPVGRRAAAAHQPPRRGGLE